MFDSIWISALARKGGAIALAVAALTAGSVPKVAGGGEPGVLQALAGCCSGWRAPNHVISRSRLPIWRRRFAGLSGFP